MRPQLLERRALVSGGAVSVARLTPSRRSAPTPRRAVHVTAAVGDAQEPLMVKAARGEACERPPAWMMRQAGRYQKAYRDLALKHPSFRERSENTDLIVAISLQPWQSFKPDGVIIFSDILTPMPAMGINMEIDDKLGPIIDSPFVRQDQLKSYHNIDLDKVQRRPFALICVPSISMCMPSHLHSSLYLCLSFCYFQVAFPSFSTPYSSPRCQIACMNPCMSAIWLVVCSLFSLSLGYCLRVKRPSGFEDM